MKIMFLGNNSYDLKDFFKNNSGNSVNVDNAYNSLVPNKSVLLNASEKINKLVIVITKEHTFNSREEFSILESIMLRNSFLKIAEIVVFIEADGFTKNIIEMFELAMDTVSYQNYSIHEVNERLTSLFIYKKIMDDEANDKAETTYSKVYRSVVGEESKIGYTPVKTNYNKIPEVQSKVEEFEKYKDNVKKISTGVMLKEIEEEIIPKQIIEVSEFKSNKPNIENITIITGTPLSGTSTLVNQLSKGLRNCLVLDLTGSTSTLELNNIDKICKVIDLKDLLLGRDYLDVENKLITIDNKDVIYPLLKYLNTSPNRIEFNHMIIECDFNEVTKILDSYELRIKQVLVTVKNNKKDIDKLVTKRIKRVDKIYLNSFFPSGIGDTKVDENYVKSIIESEVVNMRDQEISPIKVVLK